MSPALNRSFALQCFECSSGVELRTGIMFDFYPGLPQYYVGGKDTVMNVFKTEGGAKQIYENEITKYLS